MAKREYPRIWVQVATSSDPALVGREVVRMPWNRARQITSTPVEVERTSDVVRMLALGDIVEVEGPVKE